MKIRFLRDTSISYGPQRVLFGQVLEVPSDVAPALIALGDAELVDAVQIVEEIPATENRETPVAKEQPTDPPLETKAKGRTNRTDGD